jgi:hypothetical protein
LAKQNTWLLPSRLQEKKSPRSFLSSKGFFENYLSG